MTRPVKQNHQAGIIKFLPLVVICLFLGSVICSRADSNPVTTGGLDSKPYMIGHRGAAGLWPENTIAAFTKACEMGLDGVELDVLFTADNEMVVHHDFRLKQEIARQPDGAWLNMFGPAIKDLNLAELKKYDVGRLKPFTGYSLRYPRQEPVDGEKIPTLAEVVSVVKNCGHKDLKLWIEIKTSPEQPDMAPPPETAAESVVRLIREEEIVDRVLVLSFDWRSLVHIQKIAPEIPTVYLSHSGVRTNNIKPGQEGPSPWTAGFDVDDFNGSVPRAVKAAGGLLWAPNYKKVTREHIREAHLLGLKVIVWTPDSKDKMRRLIDIGVDGIITNRPDILRTILR